MDDDKKWVAYCIDCHEQLHKGSSVRDMLELAAGFHVSDTGHTVIIGFEVKDE